GRLQIPPIEHQRNAAGHQAAALVVAGGEAVKPTPTGSSTRQWHIEGFQTRRHMVTTNSREIIFPRSAAPPPGPQHCFLAAFSFGGTIRAKRVERLKIWPGAGPRWALRWPPISDGVMRLSASQLAALVDGLDWSRLHARD